jgi:hypothetical protein
MGIRRLENEDAVCPNRRYSLSWVPARLADLFIVSGDYTKVSAGLSRIEGRGTRAHIDLLVCVDESNTTCVLERRGRDANTTALSDGLYVTHFIDAGKLGAVDMLRPF